MSNLTVKCKVRFGTRRRTARDIGPSPQTVPEVGMVSQLERGDALGTTSRPASRVARMLALAYKIERMVEAGELKDQAEAARRLGITRARMAQVMALLNLAAPIQEAMLTGSLPVSERRLRVATHDLVWDRQLAALSKD